ncbi:ABC transporter permease [Metamycoplasma hyosynoviae]|nr:ABC transporter permease [Metamycoplasma hyosynoviae]MDD7896901.1 ABC transporter permease [Metamycoplasma hyosynoviae]
MNLFNAIYSSMILYFCIFVLASIGGMFSEKVGIVNVGINGIMVIGATSYIIFQDIITRIFGVAGASSMLWQLIVLPISAGIAGCYALLHGLATIKLKSEHTISGFAINLLATGICFILLGIFGHGSKAPYTNINELKYSVIDSAGRSWEIISFKLVLTIAIIVCSFIVLNKTIWGLRFRSIGENPQAADVAGINVNKYKWQGIFISGVIAGVAGVIFAQEFSSDLKTGDVRGFGYLALAIMIMGQWNIGLITVITFIFALLYSFSYYSGTFIYELKHYRDILNLVPYLVTIIVVMATAKKSHAPAAVGINYDKTLR